MSATPSPPSPPRSDRDLQDRVIRYLTDVNDRSADIADELLDAADAERAQRFSRYLVRRYYRDRLHRGFRYSRGLVDAARTAEQVVDNLEFASILSTCVLGSLQTARTVAALAVSELMGLRQDVWWQELLQYESALFLQLATSEPAPAHDVPQKSVAVVLHRFEFDVPMLLANLQSGEAALDVSHRPVTLLFSRTQHGKIYVVELDPAWAHVLGAIDGERTLADIAKFLNSSTHEIQRILTILSDIGAIVLPVS
jgi:hypothetical protein